MNKIRELRKRNNITQNELCKFLNIAQPTLSGYETGHYEPDNETLQRMAGFFKVSIDYLLGYTENETPISSNDRMFVPSQLPPDEDELLRLFRSLPPDYKNLALSTLRTWTGKSAHNLEKKNKA